MCLRRLCASFLFICQEGRAICKTCNQFYGYMAWASPHHRVSKNPYFVHHERRKRSRTEHDAAPSRLNRWRAPQDGQPPRTTPTGRGRLSYSRMAATVRLVRWGVNVHRSGSLFPLCYSRYPSPAHQVNRLTGGRVAVGQYRAVTVACTVGIATASHRHHPGNHGAPDRHRRAHMVCHPRLGRARAYQRGGAGCPRVGSPLLAVAGQDVCWHCPQARDAWRLGVRQVHCSTISQ